MTSAASVEFEGQNWIRVLRRYILFSALGHLIWETGHIPLYTIWVEDSWREIGFAILHCTGGDLLIAMSTMLLSLFVVGSSAWPFERVRWVLGVALILGVTYTVFSEWLNIVIRAAWAYRDIMPVVPVLDAGLTPLLQWVVVPSTAYMAALGFRPRDLINVRGR